MGERQKSPDLVRVQVGAFSFCVLVDASYLEYGRYMVN